VDNSLSRFIKTHHPYGVIGGLLALSLLVLVMGSKTITLPAANTGGFKELAYHSLAPLGAAALAGGCLASGMAIQERAGARNLSRAKNRYLLAISALTLALVGGTAAVTISALAAVAHTRALLIWYGLALLSARLFRPDQAWILPLATLFPLQFLGQDRLDKPYWWNWLDQTTASTPTWTIAGVAVAMGAAAVVATPWRLHTLTRYLHRRIQVAAIELRRPRLPSLPASCDPHRPRSAGAGTETTRRDR
jgi:hypothetical protein